VPETLNLCIYRAANFGRGTWLGLADIDGTITKSDVLGHAAAMFGKDWTHVGVASLYSHLAANGYHLLYLSSRSISHAPLTRGRLNQPCASISAALSQFKLLAGTPPSPAYNAILCLFAAVLHPDNRVRLTGYINGVKQNDFTLPGGPILLSPTSLMRSFHNEVWQPSLLVFVSGCLLFVLLVRVIFIY